MEHVDKTIENVCMWVDLELKKEQTREDIQNITSMVQALAALIAARAMAF